MFSCTFLGHRDCPDFVESKLVSAIEEIIAGAGVDTFYVGTEGRFDYLAYMALCKLEKLYPIRVWVVPPYLNQTGKTLYYDSQKTVFPDCLTTTPPRFAIQKRNEFLLQKADFFICYLEVPYSNTYIFVKKAKKRNLKIINLGSFPLQSVE